MAHWFQVLTPHVSKQPSCFETPTCTIPCQVSQLHLLIQPCISCNTLPMLIIERTCTKISGANQVTSSYGNVDLLEHLDVTQVSCPYNPSECVICKFPYGKPICFVVRYSRGLRVQYQKRCFCIFFLRRKRCIF